MEKLTEVSLWTKFKRPSSIPYPNTWHRFTTKPKNGKTYRVKIVDLTPDRYEESIEFIKKYYYPYEPITLASRLVEDEISFHNDICRKRAMLQQRTTIIAVLDEDVPKPEMVGIITLLVLSKDDDPVPEIPGKVQQKRIKLFNDILENHNPFELLNTDKYFDDYGLCVKPEYRGMNIAYNIVATIEKLAKAFNVDAICFICNAIGPQLIGEKLGFKLFNEIVYNEYKDDQGRILFPVEGTKSLKLMGKRYT